MSKKNKLTPFQSDLLVRIYEQQRRYMSGDWNFDGSIHSRSSFALARAYEELLPSPARGRWNMTRGFEQRFTRALARLIKLEVCEWRKTTPPEGPAAFSVGYKRHKVRDRDIFLTAEGIMRAETTLRDRGLMATDKAGCDSLPEPDGPVSADLSGCEE